MSNSCRAEASGNKTASAATQETTAPPGGFTARGPLLASGGSCLQQEALAGGWPHLLGAPAVGWGRMHLLWSRHRSLGVDVPQLHGPQDSFLVLPLPGAPSPAPLPPGPLHLSPSRKSRRAGAQDTGQGPQESPLLQRGLRVHLTSSPTPDCFPDERTPRENVRS